MEWPPNYPIFPLLRDLAPHQEDHSAGGQGRRVGGGRRDFGIWDGCGCCEAVGKAVVTARVIGGHAGHRVTESIKKANDWDILFYL